jgi:UDP-N-acetylmuramate--alanine ligase
MRSLARVLQEEGWWLTGSDMALADDDPLIRLGIGCSCSHAAVHVDADADCVIYSSAIAAANPELCRAKELGIPMLSYAEMLGKLMEGRYGLAVAGTHGKSTTTAMAAEILLAGGCDPTVVYGAAPRGGYDGGRAGRGKYVLVEACEFRRNFLLLRPKTAAILNIEPDHFDCYDSFGALESAFAEFAARLPAEGRLIVPVSNAAIERAAAAITCRVESFAVSGLADWVAGNVLEVRGKYCFDLFRHGESLGHVELSVFGQHNVVNALAAAALVSDCGVSAEHIVSGLSQFGGLRRRLELLGEAGRVHFWDDYAHHPSEISTTLKTIRQIAPGARVCCLFQPHQALRTARLLDELASSLQNAEMVLIAEIFRAREGPFQPGEVTAADLAQRLRAMGQEVPALHAPADIQQFLQQHLTPGDVLVVMGAGDIGRIGYGLMDWFREHRARG